MARSGNQKMKLLYLHKIMAEQSDQEHPITMQEIVDALARFGISAERKSLYGDFEALREFGMDIVSIRGKTTAYYGVGRNFELPELKLLVDAVQSSKFITHKKSAELIAKIEGLCSVHQAKELQRQVYVSNRIKTVNESIYYNVDTIYSAIGADKKIGFKYFEYTVDKRQQFRKNGSRYIVSPLALSWDDENYYLLAFDSQAEMIKHYRVDKMTAIAVEDDKRDGLERFHKLDMAQYSNRVFSMFGGREETVRLRFSNRLVGVVLDRFGKDIILSKNGDESFTVALTVEVSPQFFGWMAGLGKEASILSPDNIRKEYRSHIEGILKAGL